MRPNLPSISIGLVKLLTVRGQRARALKARWFTANQAKCTSWPSWEKPFWVKGVTTAATALSITNIHLILDQTHAFRSVVCKCETRPEKCRLWPEAAAPHLLYSYLLTQWTRITCHWNSCVLGPRRSVSLNRHVTRAVWVCSLSVFNKH